MNKTKKILLAIIIDILLLGVVACSVYKLVTCEMNNMQKNICMILIVFCIPAGFLTTFMNVAWERFDEDETGEEITQEKGQDGLMNEDIDQCNHL